MFAIYTPKLGKCPAGRHLDLDVSAKNDVTFEKVE